MAAGHKVYWVDGPLFFASAMEFPKQFDYDGDPDDVEIHFHMGHVLDYSAIHALNVVGERYRARGKRLHVKRLGRACVRLLHKATDLLGNFTFEVSEEDVGEEMPLERPERLHIEERDAVYA